MGISHKGVSDVPLTMHFPCSEERLIKAFWQDPTAVGVFKKPPANSAYRGLCPSLSLLLKLDCVVTPLGRTSEKEHHLVSLENMASEKRF